MIMIKKYHLYTVFISLIACTSCSNLSYYSQSIRGHFAVLAEQQKISALIEDPSTPDVLKRKLETVLSVREYASTSLGLPKNDSYRQYADIGRPYVVWNVFAAEPLSIEAKQWCFPIAGCVIYRGYFNLDDATQFADQLRDQGLDVFVGGVKAYSTLGWFDDPMLSTMINYNETELAGIMFHELAHQQLYIKNDSAFNESFATAVEIEGTRRWLQKNQLNDKFDAYLRKKQIRDEFVALILKYRQQLAQLYGSDDIDETTKLKGKITTFAKLKAEYQQLRQRWDNYAGYDRWFDLDLNNARLASIGAYHEFVPAFQTLLKKHDYRLEDFYKQAKLIGDKDLEVRHQLLNSMQHN